MTASTRRRPWIIGVAVLLTGFVAGIPAEAVSSRANRNVLKFDQHGTPLADEQAVRVGGVVDCLNGSYTVRLEVRQGKVTARDEIGGRCTSEPRDWTARLETPGKGALEPGQAKIAGDMTSGGSFAKSISFRTAEITLRDAALSESRPQRL